MTATDASGNDDLFGHLEKNEEEDKKTPARESVVLTKKERAEQKKALEQMTVLSEKLAEIETEYEAYKEEKTTEILDIKERLVQAQESAEQSAVI